MRFFNLFCWIFSCTLACSAAGFCSAQSGATTFGSGYYFASSTEAGTTRGWVFHLDVKKANGEIYDPPKMRPLKNVRIRHNELKFTSPKSAYIVYSFSGQINSQIACGKLYSGSEGTQIAQYSLCLRPFLETIIKGNELLGRYSNVKHGGAEGGDNIVGTELVLLSLENPVRGFITFFGSSLGLSRELPLYICELRRSGHTVEFSIEDQGKKLWYIATFSNSAVRLSREHDNILKTESEVLFRKKILFPR